METDSNSAIHKNPNPVSNTDEDDEFPDSRLKALSLNDPANVADGDLDLYEEASAEFVNGPFDSKPQIDEKLPSETALVEPTEVEKRDEIASNNIFADANYDKKDESLSRRENSSSVTDVAVAVAVLDAPEVGEDVEAEECGEIASNNLSADANYDSKDELLSGEENSSSVTEMSVAAGGQEVDMGVGEISFSSGIIRGENSEVEFEDQASPSSSGYAGERGSTSASVTSEIEEVEDGNRNEIVAQESDVSVNGGSNSAAWVPGKRHVDEDDASLSWRKRKKHFFVLSHSGKPIYSRYGDEHKLAGFSATLQAIISFVENGGDRVKFVRAGNHQVIFLVKGPIYLVCISCTEEPQEALRGQLELIYGQMLLILTKSINRCFERNPKFDMTPLLGGTDAVFSSLIHSFSWNPATFLHAYTCLPLAYPTRQAAGAILQDVADSGVLFAILMCKHKVISLVGAQKASLHPDDMFLLANFVLSSESFRTSESFSPICLPRYNPMAFLYAYVHYLDVDTYLVLLTTSSDAFYHLKDCRIRIEMVLLKSNVLSEVQRSMLEGGLRVEDLPTDLSRSGSLSPHLGQNQLGNESLDRLKEPNLGVGGPAGLWHFMYRSINLDQYVSSEFSSPISSSSQQKRLYRGYQKLYASMHEKGTGPHKTQFRRDENYVLLCWITQDFELYAAFDPLADKALAIKICNQVCQWVRDVENEIFLLGSSPFSW